MFRGKKEKIGDYDGLELKLGNLEPFRRALLFQALTAYNSLSPADKETFRAKNPPHFGSPVKSELLSQLCGGFEGALGETLMTSIKYEGPDPDDELLS